MNSSNEDFKRRLIGRAFSLAKRVIRLTDKFPQKRSAFVIADQLIRAITSIGANIIEAQAASSKRDFINSTTLRKKYFKFIIGQLHSSLIIHYYWSFFLQLFLWPNIFLET